MAHIAARSCGSSSLGVVSATLTANICLVQCKCIRSRALRVHARGGDGSDSDSDPLGDAFTRRALAEATELACRAQQQALDQARAEMLQQQTAWLAEQGGADGEGSGSDAGAPVLNNKGDAMSEAALAAFFKEQGLSRYKVVWLAPKVEQFRYSRTQLESKWLALQRVLPGCDLAPMVRCGLL